MEPRTSEGNVDGNSGEGTTGITCLRNPLMTIFAIVLVFGKSVFPVAKFPRGKWYRKKFLLLRKQGRWMDQPWNLSSAS